ncbi:MAG: hypothetical protein JO108_36015 [Acidobacteriaceae bacterium]|nr:hypothetical protein [Acidobacteriaceae bacterium]
MRVIPLDRLRFREPYFGGLDQMYQSHKKAAMLAIFLLIFHFFAAPLNASQLKPGTPLGMIAFLGLQGFECYQRRTLSLSAARPTRMICAYPLRHEATGLSIWLSI